MHENPPNILWICSDQQRFDTLGCYGNPYVKTPNLDNLAREGVLFEHAYSQSPVCTPSRASFLTGRYPRTTRCRQNGQAIPPDEVLVTKILQDAGYINADWQASFISLLVTRVFAREQNNGLTMVMTSSSGRTIRLMLGPHMITFNGFQIKDCAETAHRLQTRNMYE